MRVQARPITVLAWLKGLRAPRPVVHPDLVADGPVHDRHARERGRGAGHGGLLAGGQGQDHRQVLGTGARHDRVHGHLLHRVLQFLLVDGHGHPADDLLGVGRGAGEHVGHALLGGQDDGGAVGPAVLQEEPVQALFLVGLEQPRPGSARLRLGVGFLGSEGPRERVDDLRHDGPAGDGVVALHVPAQNLARPTHQRVGSEAEAQVHAVVLRVQLRDTRRNGRWRWARWADRTWLRVPDSGRRHSPHSRLSHLPRR